MQGVAAATSGAGGQAQRKHDGLRLVDDAALWSRLSAASLELVAARYSHEHGLARFRDVFDALGLDPDSGSRHVFRKVSSR